MTRRRGVWGAGAEEWKKMLSRWRGHPSENTHFDSWRNLAAALLCFLPFALLSFFADTGAARPLFHSSSVIIFPSSRWSCTICSLCVCTCACGRVAPLTLLGLTSIPLQALALLGRLCSEFGTGGETQMYMERRGLRGFLAAAVLREVTRDQSARHSYLCSVLGGVAAVLPQDI